MTTKSEADRTYGLYDKNKQFYIGNKPVDIKENNIVVDDKEYEGTPGLWELIISKKPDETLYTSDDKENYARLMVETGALHQKNNPNKPRSGSSDKWKKILSPIWENRKKY